LGTVYNIMSDNLKVLLATISVLLTVIVSGFIGFSQISGVSVFTPGNSEVVTKTYEVDEFNEIRLQTNAQVVYTQASERGVRVEAPQDIIDRLSIESKNNTLTIGQKGVQISFFWFSQRQETKIFISSPTLNSVNISGSGEIRSDYVQSDEEFRIRTSGSGDVILSNLQAPSLVASISGSGGYELGGRVETADFNINGSGDISAFSLSTRDADVSISGSGDVRVNVQNNLDISISGSGDVTYTGNPQVSQSVSGSGDVRKRD
jgi:hypothetical protein